MERQFLHALHINRNKILKCNKDYIFIHTKQVHLANNGVC